MWRFNLLLFPEGNLPRLPGHCGAAAGGMRPMISELKSSLVCCNCLRLENQTNKNVLTFGIH
jgi:hypothetical protein